MSSLRTVCISSDMPYRDIDKPTTIECVTELNLDTVDTVPNLSTIAGTISDGFWINSKTYHGEVNFKGPMAKKLLSHLHTNDHSPLIGTVHNGTYRVFATIL